MSDIEAAKATTRRRGASLEDALLEAAWVELNESGYQAFKMEAVAARANTSKAVLYRRWRTRAELVLAALRRHAPVSPARTDTGTLRGDVIAILRWLSLRYRDFPDVVRGLMLELPDAENGFSQTSEAWIRLALERAITRGEILDIPIPDHIVRLPLDLARYEMLVTRRAPETARIAEIVDDIYLKVLPRQAPIGAS